MKQHKKRIFGILLSLALALSLMPGMSLTAYADAWEGNPYASLVNTTTVVHFDGKEWYLIEDKSTALNAGTVTLLSKECVGASAYNESGSFVEYASSTVKTAVDNWYNDNNNITADEKTAVSGGAMFLLTNTQANTIHSANPDVLKCSQASGTAYNRWWLCSQGLNNKMAAFVDGETGDVSNFGNGVGSTFGVRPALQLDLSKVVFDSTSKTFSIFKSYPLWVGGTQVTSENAGNIDGNNKASYDASTNTLTLNGAVIEGVYEDQGSNIYSKDIDLTIVLNSNNVVGKKESPAEIAVCCFGGNLTIEGTGKLTAEGKYGAIYADEKISVTSIELDANGSNCEAICSGSDDVEITNSKVTAISDLDNAIEGKNIILNNADVEATSIVRSTINASGVRSEGEYVSDGNVTINGGTVKATVNDGYYGQGAICGAGNVTITGADTTVTAVANCNEEEGGCTGIYAQNGEVEINGGTVTATGGSGSTGIITKTLTLGTGVKLETSTDNENWTDSTSTPTIRTRYMKTTYSSHDHSFTYSASGTTITATCSADDCPLPSKKATLTIAAPDSLKYNGTAKAAKITDANSIQGAAKVQYQKKTDGSYGASTEIPPVDAGDYKASITLGTEEGNKATASVEYTIAQKPVTVTGITAENKEYDGNTAATLNVNSAAISGKEDGDSVALSTTSATGAFSDKTAENGKTVTISGLALTGTDASNYVLSSQPTTTANITKKAVTVTGITASNKVYDGTSSATVNCGSAVINGKVENDDLTFTAPTGSFSDKTVGEGKTVSFSGLALSGADAANYSLSAQPADTTANITAKPVTITGVTAEDKVYDGNLTATLIAATAVIDGKVDSDDLSFVKGTGLFSDKNVGKDKTVSFSGFVLSGNDSANYTLDSQPADTTADITAKEVKVSGITASDKIYDGTTDVTLDYTSASFDGRVGDDNLTVTATGAFADANAGQGKTVNITGLTLGGTGKANYVLAAEGQQTTDQADIAQKSITGATVTLDKTQLTYNGQEQSVSVTGVTTSDGMTLTANDYEIVSGNTGTDIGDYTVIIEGKGNYKDEATADWKIVEKVSPTPTPTPQPAKVSGTQTAKMTAGKKSMTIAWNKIQGADGYDIFFAACNSHGKSIACKNVKNIKGNKTFKWTKSGLKKGTSYKAYVKAYKMVNGKKTYIKTSPIMHAYTGNGTKKYTNAKSVTVKKAKVSLKKGKTYKIKAKVNKIKKNKKLMPKSHVATLRYLTSNKKVATVSKSGKITAKGKGSCVVYVYAHNGVSKSVKVTVK